jgi:hypothetical protein
MLISDGIIRTLGGEYTRTYYDASRRTLWSRSIGLGALEYDFLATNPGSPPNVPAKQSPAVVVQAMTDAAARGIVYDSGSIVQSGIPIPWLSRTKFVKSDAVVAELWTSSVPSLTGLGRVGNHISWVSFLLSVAIVAGCIGGVLRLICRESPQSPDLAVTTTKAMPHEDPAGQIARS